MNIPPRNGDVAKLGSEPKRGNLRRQRSSPLIGLDGPVLATLKSRDGINDLGMSMPKIEYLGGKTSPPPPIGKKIVQGNKKNAQPEPQRGNLHRQRSSPLIRNRKSAEGILKLLDHNKTLPEKKDNRPGMANQTTVDQPQTGLSRQNSSPMLRPDGLGPEYPKASNDVHSFGMSMSKIEGLDPASLNEVVKKVPKLRPPPEPTTNRRQRTPPAEVLPPKSSRNLASPQEHTRKTSGMADDNLKPRPPSRGTLRRHKSPARGHLPCVNVSGTKEDSAKMNSSEGHTFQIWIASSKVPAVAAFDQVVALKFLLILPNERPAIAVAPADTGELGLVMTWILLLLCMMNSLIHRLRPPTSRKEI